MKKILLNTICVILSGFLFCGCAPKQRAAFDLGKFNGQKYENNYLGLHFDAGEFTVLNEKLDDRLKPLYNIAEEEKSFMLATLSKGNDTNIVSYPVIQVIAHHVSGLQYINSAKDYLEKASSAFNEANTEYYEIEKNDVTLNGRMFSTLVVQIFTSDDQMIYLDLYVTVEGDYFVVFAALALDPQQSDTVNNVIQTIRFS